MSLKGGSRTQATSWRLLRDYLAALADLEAADWISFRNDMYALQDLATDWSDRVKAWLSVENKH